MEFPRAVRVFLRAGAVLTMTFLYAPLLIVVIYAFNKTRVQRWPPSGLTLSWFEKASHNSGALDALWVTVQVAVGATLVALVLGSLAAFALARFGFFGKGVISFLILLPIALPGIVTGMALNATFTQALGSQLGLATIIVAHATFCIVVVFNNVVARLRRLPVSLEQAAADLGASPLRTFRDITFPQMRTALIAGGLLAFGLSFDEIVVTTFTAGNQQTLPIWILSNLSRPNNLPVVNVVAMFVVLLSVIPVYVAQRLTADPVGMTTTAA